MTNQEKIEKALAIVRQPDNSEIARQRNPPQQAQTPPSYYRQELEREARSPFSGGNWGGGRSR
jgi:hypothetical protein